MAKDVVEWYAVWTRSRHEQVVRDQVQQAGFRLVAEDRFLRNPDDPRDWNADSGVNKTHTQDRFALKFVKP